MKTKKSVLAIIPARGGSKGIKNKNLRLLNNKPLIQYSIDAAKNCNLIDKIIVSTDSIEIADFSETQGVGVIQRPTELSKDSSLVIDAIRHVLVKCKTEMAYSPEIVILLECTSPFKSQSEISIAIEKLLNGEADSAATFKETEVSPYRLWTIENEKVNRFISDATPFMPRQTQPKAYNLTGQVYSFTTKILEENPNSISILLGNLYPIITKTEAIDIDTEFDLFLAEQIIKYYKK